MPALSWDTQTAEGKCPELTDTPWSSSTMEQGHGCAGAEPRAQEPPGRVSSTQLTPILHSRGLTWICHQQCHCTAGTSGDKASSSNGVMVLGKFHKYQEHLSAKSSELQKPPAQEREGRAESEGPHVQAPKPARVHICGGLKVILMEPEGHCGQSWVLFACFPSTGFIQVDPVLTYL